MKMWQYSRLYGKIGKKVVDLMKSTMRSLENNRKGKYRNMPRTYEKDSVIFMDPYSANMTE